MWVGLKTDTLPLPLVSKEETSSMRKKIQAVQNWPAPKACFYICSCVEPRP